MLHSRHIEYWEKCDTASAIKDFSLEAKLDI